MPLSCPLQRLNSLLRWGGRGEEGKKGASLDLAVVLSWKQAVGQGHMVLSHPLSCGSVSGNTKAHKDWGPKWMFTGVCVCEKKDLQWWVYIKGQCMH